MMKLCVSLIIVVSASIANATPTFTKVMIVVLENTNYEQAMNQPYMSTLARNGALLSNFHGVWHPSQPNYIAMTSGGLHRVLTDRDVTVDEVNIVDLIERAGKTWKVYAEQYPGNCFLGATSGKYARKHNPFLTYKDIQDNPSRCSRIVNANELAADVAKDEIANYNFYVPDLNDDGHDTTPAYSDTWLKNTFEPLLRDPKFSKGLLFVVTFDESETYLNNHIFTVLFGDSVVPGTTSNQRYTHYSLLSTIEDAWGLGNLSRRDYLSRPIQGVWRK